MCLELLITAREQTATGSTLDYTSEAYDLSTGAYSWISIWSTRLHWTVAYEGVLEVYNVNSCSQLPASGYDLFFANYVDTDIRPTSV